MYRDLGNIYEKIIETVIHMGAEKGVTKVSSKKIAAECGIATFTVFDRFGTMRNLIDSAAQEFDRKNMDFCIKMVEQNQTIEVLWDKMIDLFLEDSDGTLFYISYTSTYGFDPTKSNPRAEEFLQIAKCIFHSRKKITDEEYLVLWDYITSMAFYYAEKFIHYMPYNEENKALIKKIVFAGVNGLIE